MQQTAVRSWATRPGEGKESEPSDLVSRKLEFPIAPGQITRILVGSSNSPLQCRYSSQLPNGQRELKDESALSTIHFGISQVALSPTACV